MPTQRARRVVSAVPTVAFNNVEINLGAFVQGLTGGLFHTVQQVLAPIQPVLNVLTRDLPVLSNLGVHLSLVDLCVTTAMETLPISSRRPAA